METWEIAMIAFVIAQAIAWGGCVFGYYWYHKSREEKQKSKGEKEK